MNRGKSQVKTRLGGYTIVETLIFLAVSSAMFVAAMLLIGGQQGKTEFVNAVRDFETQLTDLTTNVSTGYYNRPSGFDCASNGGSPAAPVMNANRGAALGTNGDCMLVGVILKLGNGNGNYGQYLTIPMVGLRQYGNAGGAGQDSRSLGDAQPQPIDAVTGLNAYRNAFNAIQTVDFQYGASVGCVALNPLSTPPTCSGTSNAAIGFFTPLKDVNGNVTQSGAIQNEILLYPGVTTDYNIPSTEFAINGINYSSPGGNIIQNPNKVAICLLSGSSNQHAWIYIGANEGSTAFSEIGPGRVCS